MKTIKILSPVKCIDDMDLMAKTGCKSVYAYHSVFLEDKSHDSLKNYINKAKEHDFEFFVNFKSEIKETEIPHIVDFIEFLTNTAIDGILINSFDILEIIKNSKLPFKVLIDSGLNIHNLSGIEFVNNFHLAENINITEEIYLKNLIKIKKYTKYKLSIDTDNLSWIAKEIKKSKSIDSVIIKGDFESSRELLQGIQLIENILDNPKVFENRKLPFKHFENSHYKSNHFSGEFLSANGKDFKFTDNIQQFKWKFKKTRLLKKPDPDRVQIPRLNLRLTSLEQLKYLKNYLRYSKFNPVYSIEYGEILNTADLSKYSFNAIIEKVKKDCLNYGIKLQLSTPKILIERDFDRVFEYVKLLCIKEPYPDSIVVNNIGYWWAVINDSDFNKIPVELGHGLNLLNSVSASCLTNQHPVSSIDLSNFASIHDIKLCVDKIKDKIPTRKLTVAGSVRIPSSGLCPLNNDSSILSRLSCAAPCHRGNYAISDPAIGMLFPIAVDGFCRMHLFKDQVLDIFKHIKLFQNIGINEFIIDFNGLSSELVPVLLNRFLNSLYSDDYSVDPDFVTNLYGIE